MLNDLLPIAAAASVLVIFAGIGLLMNKFFNKKKDIPPKA